ncbi:TolB family protein [Oceanitalea stevensii]|uniref:Uncharacterized protein n=1 Tax=Oceanitalea stevensii TaxID=2763072 RepID=A0ABR8Z4W5_9MICO|nr:hypothetical protein [Oceanitalea stevensii]MBD8063294.1 hypothetical protein [Oceanitalea stevensii]
MRSPAPSPGAIGLGVLVVGVVLALLPGWLLPGRWFGPDPATGPATIPARFADYSYLTGSVSASPPGRALAVYQHGFGVELMDFPQAVVAGADGGAYRRLDVAERRGASQGDPGPMLLSPDGARVAVGRWHTSWPDVAVVDLATGDADKIVVPGDGSALPLAWSPDSTLLAYVVTDGPADPYTGSALSGELGLLDVTTGEAQPLPAELDAREAAFSPDGTELAVHRIVPDDGTLSGQDGIPRMGGGAVDVVGLDGTLRRTVPMPENHYLDGPNAWSPDGALLATAAQWVPACDHLEAGGEAWADCFNTYEGPSHGIVFLDASGQDGGVPAPIPASRVGWDGVLGWTAEGEPLFLDGPDDPETADTDLYWLTAVPLDGGEPRPLSAVPGGGNYGVGAFQLATGLLPGAEVRDADATARGLWPTGARLGAAVAGSAVAALATGAVGRWRRRAASA